MFFVYLSYGKIFSSFLFVVPKIMPTFAASFDSYGRDIIQITKLLGIFINLKTEKHPVSLLKQGASLEKSGGLLLSRIALQYHRRKRA